MLQFLKKITKLICLAGFAWFAVSASVSAQTTYLGGCIQFDANGYLDCSPTPNSVGPWQWQVSLYSSASVVATGPTEDAALESYKQIFANQQIQGGNTGLCGITIKDSGGAIVAQSNGFDFGRFATSQSRERPTILEYCQRVITSSQNYTYYGTVPIGLSASRIAKCAEPFIPNTYSVVRDSNLNFVTNACQQALSQPNREIAPSCRADDGMRTQNPILPATGQKQLNETDFGMV